MSEKLSIKTDHAIQSALNSMAKEVKAGREAKQLSQRELSARTGIPQSHISKIENGGADIRISSMLSISRALDLELTLIPRSLIVTLNALRNNTVHGQEGAVLTQAPAYQLDEEEDDG